MGAFFSSPKKPKVIEPPATQDQAIQDVAADRRKAAAMMKGRAATQVASKGLGYVAA
jgi:hypothetical protein